MLSAKEFNLRLPFLLSHRRLNPAADSSENWYKYRRTMKNTGPLMMKMKRSIKYLILVLALTLGGPGCRRGGAPGELTMMLEKRVPTFDPRVSSDSAAERMRQLLFNSLTRKGEKFEPEADLAAAIEPSPDFKTFTFRLRSGIKFHDGRALTSGDVKYTFDTMMARGFASDKKAEFVRELAGIETPDSQTVVFRCLNAYPGLPNAIVPVGIVPDGSGDAQAKRPVGTGPFKFESYAEDQEVVLSAFDGYYEGRAGVDRLRVKIVPDNSTRESELRKGSVDLAINADFEPVTVESLAKAEGLKVETMPGTNITHIGVNLLDPILKDRRVRQALAHAVDRDMLIRDVLRGQARPASSILPAAQWAYSPDVTSYAYDPARAKQLLDEAGRKAEDGKPRFRISLKTSTLSIARKLGEAIQEQLRRVEVAVDVQPLERGKLTQDMTDGNFQLYTNTLVGGNQSAEIFKYVYASKSVPPNGQNRSRYQNPLLDRLLDEAPTAAPERQRAIFAEVQKILSEDLPQIYLWYPDVVAVYRLRVSNLKLDPSADWRVVRQIKLKDE